MLALAKHWLISAWSFSKDGSDSACIIHTSHSQYHIDIRQTSTSHHHWKMWENQLIRKAMGMCFVSSYVNAPVGAQRPEDECAYASQKYHCWKMNREWRGPQSWHRIHLDPKFSTQRICITQGDRQMGGAASWSDKDSRRRKMGKLC